MKRELYTAKDGKKINLCIWDEVESYPKGVVQIAHGMSEHIERYDDFAKFLNSKGYIVAGDDHRGHGKTDEDKLGINEDGTDIFFDTVSDLIEITAYLKQKYKQSVILFGHSYGSFLAQRYLSVTTENLSGIILSGSALMGGIEVKFGHYIAKRKVKKGKANQPGKLFKKLTFEGYDKKIKDGVNGWLSREMTEVGKYNADQLCGFVCSNGFYESFFRGLKTIEKNPHEGIDREFKLFIISGGDDGVGKYGKLVIKLYENYKALGFKPFLKIYDGARHEILNETNKQEVYSDVLDFISSLTE